MAPALLVAVVAVAVGGRATNRRPDSAPVVSPAVFVADVAPPEHAALVAPSRPSYRPAVADRAQPDPLAERVNKFTIDDQVARNGSTRGLSIRVRRGRGEFK